MYLDRRQMLGLAAAAAAAATGCDGNEGESGQAAEVADEPPPPGDSASAGASSSSAPTPGTSAGFVAVDAGPLAGFGADGVYDAYREQGFFLVRRDGKLFALSSVCTHKGCKVRAQADESFRCKCHGSTFDPEGRVTKPPAKRDLPRLKVAVDGREHVLVRIERRRPT